MAHGITVRCVVRLATQQKGKTMARTPEQGHTAPCLAKAMICAIENARDRAIEDSGGEDGLAQYDFRLMAQGNVALTWADGYLSDGTATCICDDHTRTTVSERPECDIHKHDKKVPDVPAAVDGKTKMGPWANMCLECFNAYGVGLGLGRGQLLIVEGE